MKSITLRKTLNLTSQVPRYYQSKDSKIVRISKESYDRLNALAYRKDSFINYSKNNTMIFISTIYY